MPTIEPVTAKRILPMTTPAPRFLPLETIPVRLETLAASARNPVFGIISNMSKTGACVITNAGLPEDTAIRLSVSGGRAGHEVVAARVIWCAERVEPVKEIVGYLTGVAFDAGTDEIVDQLLACGIFQLVP